MILELLLAKTEEKEINFCKKAKKMHRTDTIDKGPNKLILKQNDFNAYAKHRKRISDMKPIVDFGTGKHIVRVSPHGPRH